jgi:hypothetical protein
VYVRYSTSAYQNTRVALNFLELRQRELPRIPLLRLYEKWSSEGISLL